MAASEDGEVGKLPPQVRDRVVGLERVRAGDLAPNPHNWRTHNEAQRRALRAMLGDVGYVGAAIARRRSDGKLELIDGHLRASLNPDQVIPVQVVDLDEEEALRALASFDPIGAMAGASRAALDELRSKIRNPTEELEALMKRQLSSSKLLEREAANATLASRFLVPPFSILDTRQAYWQDRKRAWLALGIESEQGRAMIGGRGNSTGPNSAMNRMSGRLARDPDDDSPIVSVFDPVLCEALYAWFVPPQGLVLDPFAGGSVRGIVAGRLGRRYSGIELQPGQVEANRRQAQDILGEQAAKLVEWRAGDSRLVLQGNDRFNVAQGGADFLFSCPPYGDLEVYSDDPADLSYVASQDLPRFFALYTETIKAACALLKEDRFAAFVVGDFRTSAGLLADFVSATISAFGHGGCALYNEAILVQPAATLALRAGRIFNGGRKLGKSHQNVLVFVKGSWEAAAKACGQVEVVDLSAQELEQQKAEPSSEGVDWWDDGEEKPSP